MYNEKSEQNDINFVERVNEKKMDSRVIFIEVEGDSFMIRQKDDSWDDLKDLILEFLEELDGNGRIKMQVLNVDSPTLAYKTLVEVKKNEF